MPCYEAQGSHHALLRSTRLSPCLASKQNIKTNINHFSAFLPSTDSGLLSLCYLGTKPPVNAMMSQVRELDYEKIDMEHKQLLQVIRESQYDNKAEASGQVPRRWCWCCLVLVLVVILFYPSVSVPISPRFLSSSFSFFKMSLCSLFVSFVALLLNYNFSSDFSHLLIFSSSKPS
jgi:hypothetical protein